MWIEVAATIGGASVLALVFVIVRDSRQNRLCSLTKVASEKLEPIYDWERDSELPPIWTTSRGRNLVYQALSAHKNIFIQFPKEEPKYEVTMGKLLALQAQGFEAHKKESRGRSQLFRQRPHLMPLSVGEPA